MTIIVYKAAADHGGAQGDGFGIIGHRRIKVFLSGLGCQLGFRLGCEIIRRHDAKHRLATDTPNQHLPDNGRAPVPVFSLAGDYRIFGDVGHHGIASEDSSPQLSRDVNACVGFPVPRKPRPCF
jgi:hypothetical protein